MLEVFEIICNHPLYNSHSLSVQNSVLQRKLKVKMSIFLGICQKMWGIVKKNITGLINN
jgi:hypothetical protein